MVPAYKRFRNPSLGQESEGGASEGIFLAGENPRVLTRLARFTATFRRERHRIVKSPADLLSAPWAPRFDFFAILAKIGPGRCDERLFQEITDGSRRIVGVHHRFQPGSGQGTEEDPGIPGRLTLHRGAGAAARHLFSSDEERP